MEKLKLNINIKKIFFAFILVVIGVMGAVIPSEFNWLSTVLFGSVGLILLVGYNTFKSLMRPMKKPFLLKLILLFLLSFFIKGALIAIGELFHIVNVDSFVTNPAVNNSGQSTVLNNLLEVIKTSVSIVGEEFLVTVIIVPIYFYLNRYRFGWILSNLIGCTAFGIMHIFTYDLQIWPCLMVGLSRYPYSEAWKTTGSLRGGIYIHLISDLIVLLPTALI